MINPVSYSEANNLLESATQQVAIHFGRVLVISYLLPNGFVITEVATCANTDMFDFDTGVKICKNQAIDTLIELLTFERFQQC